MVTYVGPSSDVGPLIQKECDDFIHSSASSLMQSGSAVLKQGHSDDQGRGGRTDRPAFRLDQLTAVWRVNYMLDTGMNNVM